MSATSSIEWTEKTWNPVRGCSIVSPGCVNCYAMKQAHRFSGEGKAYHGLTKHTKAGPQWTGKVVTVDSALLEPLKWRKPQRIFVNSMSDLFHDDVPDEFISQVFAVMALASHHTFQILTKRADRMRAYLDEMSSDPDAYCFAWAREAFDNRVHLRTPTWPLPNVWLGVSCESQQYADERIPLLLHTPAAVRWVSAEPLLGPIDFTFAVPNHDLGGEMPAIGGLDWIVVGGESGPRSRPFDIQWARDILAQCRTAGTYYFLKQLGSNPDNGAQPDGGLIQVYIHDRKGGDITEWPTDLRVREYPRAEVVRA